MKKHPLLRTALLVMTAAALLCVSALAVEDGAPANSMYGTFWALVPPVIAITLALITKEAYSSLFIGIVACAGTCRVRLPSCPSASRRSPHCTSLMCWRG